MNRHPLRWLLVATFLAACTLYAFVTQKEPMWPNGNVTMHLQLGATPVYPDGSTPNSTGTAALQHWNGYMGRVQFVANPGSNAGKRLGNGTNNVYFASSVNNRDFPPGVLAVAMAEDDGTHRTEADVVVNTDYTWGSYRGPLSPDKIVDLRRVLIHEFGHVLGLGHPDEAGQYVEAIMNSQISHLDSTTQDDQDGVASLYGRGILNPVVPPRFGSDEPWDQEAEAGSHVYFHVAVEGTMPITYQWYKDGVPIPGATEAGLHLPEVRSSAAGNYHVRAMNEGGTATSRTAKLTVKPPKPPKIWSSDPPDATVTESAPVWWLVAVEGTPPMTYQWLKDGVEIPDATSNYFAIESVSLADAGRYRLRATNEVGSVLSREARLRVNPGQPPTIEVWPQPKSAMVGQDVSIRVWATSNVPITYQWFKDGTPLESYQHDSMQISGVDASHEGDYAVTVSTEFGSITTEPVRLTVYPARLPPIVAIRASQTFVEAGQWLQLSADDQNAGPFEYRWYHNGRRLPVPSSSSLFDSNTTLEDAGEYRVVLSNDTGSAASAPIRITVRSPTDPSFDWLVCETHGDTVYLLPTGTTLLERFSLAQDRFLTPISFASKATAIDVDGGSIFAAFGDQVMQFSVDGGAGKVVGTAPGVVRSLVRHGNYLYGQADRTGDFGVTRFSLGLMAGEVVGLPGYHPEVPQVTIDASRARLIVTTAHQSGLVIGIPLGLDGTFGADGVYGESHRAGTDRDRLWMSPDFSRVLKQSGIVYNADNLELETLLAERFDDAGFLPDGRLVVLRGTELTGYSAEFKELGNFSLTEPGSRLVVDHNAVVVFTSPATPTGSIGWQRVNLDQFALPSPAMPVNPRRVLYEPDGVWLAADGTVLLYSRQHQCLFRWSVAERRYLPAIPVPGEPTRMAYAREYDRLYLGYQDGQIRTLSPSATQVLETFGGAPGAITALVPIGDKILASSRAYSSAIHEFFDLGGARLGSVQAWSGRSRALAWSAVKRRLYYFNGDVNGLPLTFHHVPDEVALAVGGPSVSFEADGTQARPPIILSPASDLVLLGNGSFYDADTLEEKPFSLGSYCDAAVWQGTTLFTATNRLDGVRIERRNGAEYVIDRSQKLPGRVLDLFATSPTELLVVTSHVGVVQFTLLDRELNVLDQSPTVSGAPTRLVNLSTRGNVGSDDEVMIAGFVVSGKVPKRVLVRAVGPTLASKGVDGVLDDPVLSVYNHTSTQIAANDNWGDTNPDELAAAFDTVGAFSLADGSADAAMILTLAPGAYTAVVSGKGASTGVALVEAYDLEPTAEAHRLINISTRARVSVGSGTLIAGMAVTGKDPKRLLIRAIGPGLFPLGIPEHKILWSPRLEVVDEKGRIVATNERWQWGNPEAVRSACEITGAFPLHRGRSDAAMVTMLEPGLYTVLVHDSTGSRPGIALVEVYEIP